MRGAFAKVTAEPSSPTDRSSSEPRTPAESTAPDTPGLQLAASSPSPAATTDDAANNNNKDDESMWLIRASVRWPVKSGGRYLRQRAGPGYYDGLLETNGDAVTADEHELLRLDVERSHVDDLEGLYPEWLTEAALRDALTRLLTCWCNRRPGGYCQGLNFPAKVLLVVFYHGATLGGEGGRDRGDSSASTSSPPSAGAQVAPAASPQPPADAEDGAAASSSSSSSFASARPPDDAIHHAEELAFWTFVAMLELLLPKDFYAAPDMLGLQVDARVLFELFLCSRLGARRDGEWRDILRLCAYKWFVPCYVNAVPLQTLLAYWDALFLRRPRFSQGGGGLSSAHLMLALALVSSTLDETRDEMADSNPQEMLGYGFNRLLSGALAHLDVDALIATARRFEVSPRQLAYLRAHLGGAATPRPRPRGRRGADEAEGGMGEPPLPPREPQLNALHVVAFWLMRRSERLPLRLLKHSLLLLQPPPLPTRSQPSQAFFTAFVSMCAVFFAACCLQWYAYLPRGRPRDVIKEITRRRLMQFRSWKAPDLIP